MLNDVGLIPLLTAGTYTSPQLIFGLNINLHCNRCNIFVLYTKRSLKAGFVLHRRHISLKGFGKMCQRCTFELCHLTVTISLFHGDSLY